MAPAWNALAVTSRLSLASLAAPCAAPFCAAVARHVSRTTGLALDVADGDWRDLQTELQTGQAQVGFVCGLHYVKNRTALHLLASPVPIGPRYGDRPVYFSDVLVRADSPYQALEDLRGARFGYNITDSHSGYVVMAAHLAGQSGFFSACVETGAHQQSIASLQAGAIDCAAIDSTVLDLLPPLHDLRVVATLGPSPHPPFVTSAAVPHETHARLQAALLAMHETPSGRQALSLGNVARFEAVTDADYDPIRRMAAEAALC